MKFLCSGVILAGGENKRFMGANKAFCRINGKRNIDRIYDVFKEIFTEIILVSGVSGFQPELDVTVVKDIFSVRSSLTGIHTGLFYSNNPYVFISACDTPFLRKELVKYIVSQIDGRYDAVIPQTKFGMEPLCAVYAKRRIPFIEKKLMQEKYRIRSIFQKDRIKSIPENVLRKHDEHFLSFFNINTPADIVIAEKLAIQLYAYEMSSPNLHRYAQQEIDI